AAPPAPSPGPAQSPSTAHAPATTPARNSVTFDGLVDAAIRQERRLTDLMRYFKPIVETYMQEEGADSGHQTSPKGDDYFLSRLDLTGKTPVSREFAPPERSKEGGEKKLPESPQALAEVFAQAVFPDLDHFDRPNYTFEFVRWEILGEVRCAVIDVRPLANAQNRGFAGRIWVEDQDFNIVRFNGAYTAKAFSKHPFHFDSWRLNTLSITWMPAYVYTEESDPRDPSGRRLWFKAQTRIWGYDLENAGEHREFAKPLTDTPAWIDPSRHEASQDLSPEFTVGKTTYTAEEEVVERLQVAGLMAADGEVDRILETVANNLLITNNLDLAGVRCRVLLTTPLESFVVGRTIVLSRGLLDVTPDEATLAAVLAHELGHIVLGQSLAAQYLAEFNLPFSDLEIFAKFNFRFDPAQEAAADKKGLELIANSPYKDQIANMALFLKAVELRSPQLPNLLHGRFSNDFASSHLVGMQALANASKHVQTNRPDQIAALPLGSRIKLDPWADQIEMVKTAPLRPPAAFEKMPFEVAPFFPYLKRLDDSENPQGGVKP
ncbi:MAG TPA: M48 family metalloprotease, partial [Candidatus Sulfotelmatobacter sp.]|nr:M48 family metalloprotease [Candidatus Sulfotelmatobacter sp.]